MASKLSALKIVESAHMPELKKLKDVLLKTKDCPLKTKDGLLKSEDVLLKTKDSPSVNNKLLTHILTNIPTHLHTDIRLRRLQ